MKQMRMFWLLVLSLSLSTTAYAGCDVDDHVDEFSKLRIVRQQQNVASSSSGTFGFNLFLAQGKPLEMEVITWNRDWLFVQRGQNSLKFLADGEVVEFPVSAVDRMVLRGYRSVSTRESFFIAITDDQLRKLIAAKELKCRIYGKRAYSEAEGKDMQRVQRCWLEFLDKMAAN